MADTKNFTTMSADSSTGESKRTKRSGADEIWEEISNLSISIFALPGQKVMNHFNKIDIPSEALYLTPKSAAAIPALEEAIGNGFTFETTDKGHLIVKRVPKSLV
jgi:hypothetical protein